jgi:hypothetical protein
VNGEKIKAMFMSFAKPQMLDGRLPSRDVTDISRVCKLLSCPMDVGRVPFSFRPNRVK